MESHSNADKLLKNIEVAEKELLKYQEQANQLDATLLKLMRCVKFNTAKPPLSTSGLSSEKGHLADFANAQPAQALQAPFIGEAPSI